MARRRELIRDVPGEPDGLERWQTLRDAIADLPPPLGDRIEHPDWIHHYGWPGARHYHGHTPNDLDWPAKTVKAGVHGVPGGETVMKLDDGSIRYMTVREVARVMTFPNSWRLAGPRGEQMRQLGNVVPVDLGRVMADAVPQALKSGGQKHETEAVAQEHRRRLGPRDPAVTSRMMAAVRNKDSKAELSLRRALHAAGLRYRLHANDVPGRPDIVIRRRRLAVFVDGDMSHGNPEEVRRRGRDTLADLFPSRTEWWVAKIERNRARDREVTERLQREGWIVVRLWEHDVLLDPDAAARKVLQAAG